MRLLVTERKGEGDQQKTKGQHIHVRAKERKNLGIQKEEKAGLHAREKL